jgi:ribosome-binding ATPase YchF (GTP1/OBG family)
VKLVDVAGLVPGAHLGKGLGNKFLDDARQADALIQIIDASGSTDSNGKPVPSGSISPVDEIKFVEEEFDLWLASIVGKNWLKSVRESESTGQKIEQMLSKRLSGLAITEQQIIEALHSSDLSGKKPTLWTEADIQSFCSTLRKKSKPFIIVANKADMPSSEPNIQELRSLGYTVIPCASEAEAMLRKAAKKGILHYLPGDSSFQLRQDAQLTVQQKRALDLVAGLLHNYGSTGVQESINNACFGALKLIAVYPVEDEARLSDKKGNILPDVRLLKQGSTALQLAETVHGELAKGFLHAIDARTKQRIGADHNLKDGDVIKIVSASSRG